MRFVCGHHLFQIQNHFMSCVVMKCTCDIFFLLILEDRYCIYHVIATVLYKFARLSLSQMSTINSSAPETGAPCSELLKSVVNQQLHSQMIYQSPHIPSLIFNCYGTTVDNLSGYMKVCKAVQR